MDAFQLERAHEILTELRSRAEHQFHSYEPFPNQLEFHRCKKYIRCIFGGNQSGKSRCTAQEAAWWFTHSHPHLNTPKRPVVIWVISTEYRTIKAGVYRHLMETIPKEYIAELGPRIQMQDIHSYMKSTHGDLIEFISSKGAEDARKKFQAAEVDLIVIDEEIENWIWDEIQARMITTGGRICISATLVESYDWIVELEKRGKAGDPDIFTARLVTTKNPYVNQEQIKRLLSSWDADTQHYRIYGFSRRGTGLVYKGWGEKVLVDPFEIPEHWIKSNILDPGFRVCASLWVAVNEYNQHICYRELFAQEATIYDVAEEIQHLEDELIDYRIIDDRFGSRLVTGDVGVLNILGEYYQLYYTPAMKSKHYGIEAVRGLLKEGDEEGVNKYGLPNNRKLFAFNTCQHLHREMSIYKIRPPAPKKDKNAPVDEPVKKDDHLPDCLRYHATSNITFFKRPTVNLKEKYWKEARCKVSRTMDDALETYHNRWGKPKPKVWL